MTSAPQPDLPDPSPPRDGCRCACGRLLARLVEGGVEIKCTRCKRTTRLPLEPLGDAAGRNGRCDPDEWEARSR